jgi:hypothetical protein
MDQPFENGEYEVPDKVNLSDVLAGEKIRRANSNKRGAVRNVKASSRS